MRAFQVFLYCTNNTKWRKASHIAHSVGDLEKKNISIELSIRDLFIFFKFLSWPWKLFVKPFELP